MSDGKGDFGLRLEQEERFGRDVEFERHVETVTFAVGREISPAAASERMRHA